MSKFEIIHIGFSKVYKYKSICFEWHDYMGPTFLRFKDFESKTEQYRPMRDYGILTQWLNLSDTEKERYRV